VYNAINSDKIPIVDNRIEINDLAFILPSNNNEYKNIETTVKIIVKTGFGSMAYNMLAVVNKVKNPITSIYFFLKGFIPRKPLKNQYVIKVSKNVFIISIIGHTSLSIIKYLAP
jgi:hypothetical protein